jgi:hypothetical protein
MVINSTNAICRASETNLSGQEVLELSLAASGSFIFIVSRRGDLTLRIDACSSFILLFFISEEDVDKCDRGTSDTRSLPLPPVEDGAASEPSLTKLDALPARVDRFAVLLCREKKDVFRAVDVNRFLMAFSIKGSQIIELPNPIPPSQNICKYHIITTSHAIHIMLYIVYFKVV